MGSIWGELLDGSGWRVVVSKRFQLPSEVLGGDLKANKMKLVQAWIEIHQEELMADWELASQGEQIFKIDPLK